jgi:hypothetical protein
MGEGRTRETWNHTAALLAMLANAHHDPKKKPQPFKPADFHPFGKRQSESSSMKLKAPITVLKTVFVRADS